MVDRHQRQRELRDQQTDGNFVVSNSAGTAALWSTYTYIGGAGSTLKIQDDGNLVVYRTNGTAAWNRGAEPNHITIGAIASGTSLISTGTQYRATMQTDGNFVIYTSVNAVLWFTGTSGYPGAHLAYQADGNAVVYTTGAAAVWSSGTGGLPWGRFELGYDSNLVVYTVTDFALWSRWFGAAQPSTDNMRPTANLSLDCFSSNDWTGSSTFCQTDNAQVSLWADTAYAVFTSGGNANIHATVEGEYDATDLDMTWVSTPTLSGPSETDIIYVRSSNHARWRNDVRRRRVRNRV